MIMKKNVLALMMATASFATLTPSLTAYAAPDNQQLQDSREKYAEIESKISEIEGKIYDIEEEMTPLQTTIEENNEKVDELNGQIDAAAEDIKAAEEEMNNIDAALGERVRAVYMSGDMQFNYLSFLINSEDIGDFFSRVKKVSQILGKDKDNLDQATAKQQEIQEKIDDLNSKKEEITKLTKDSQTKIDELNKKKDEQQKLADEAEEERSKFDEDYLSGLEEDIVKPQFDVIDNDNSTSAELKAAMDQLKSVRDNQIKSEIVKNKINEKLDAAQTAYDTKLAAEQAGANRGMPSGQTVSGDASAIISEAYNHLNKPYVFGGNGPDVFDCSGFTKYVYQHALGINLERTTYGQINQGVAVSQSELQPGDLVFPSAGHVGIYIGNGQMIHAPHTGDVVKVSNVYAFYAARRIIS